jgi:hypothetical protein
MGWNVAAAVAKRVVIYLGVIADGVDAKREWCQCCMITALGKIDGRQCRVSMAL